MTPPKPSVDLGYPTPIHGRIPAFQNIEEEAAFWDTHSFAEFEDELTPVDVMVGEKLSAPLSVQLDPLDRADIDRRARAKGVDSSTLVRIWIEEHLRQGAASESALRQPEATGPRRGR